MKTTLLREITPLTLNDCFTVLSRTKKVFDFPLHYHEEFELNLIKNAKGAKRVVGDHVEEITDLELVLVGPNLQHGWFSYHSKSDSVSEVTIQFHRDLFDEKFLQRNQMHLIKTMFDNSLRGILFSKETIESVTSKLSTLSEKQGFDSVLELISILNELSKARNTRLLSHPSSGNKNTVAYNSRRVQRIMEHINHNFHKTVTLGEAAKIAGMTEVALSRFFKLRTGKSFIDTVNEVRLGTASRMLIETTQSINEIATACGFTNISNFNRIFRKKKLCTPKEFRETFNASGVRTFR